MLVAMEVQTVQLFNKVEAVITQTLSVITLPSPSMITTTRTQRLLAAILEEQLKPPTLTQVRLFHQFKSYQAILLKYLLKCGLNLITCPNFHWKKKGSFLVTENIPVQYHKKNPLSFNYKDLVECSIQLKLPSTFAKSFRSATEQIQLPDLVVLTCLNRCLTLSTLSYCRYR